MTLGLFPTAWLLARFTVPLLSDWPTVAQLVTNAIGVVALTWLVMPLLNRVLAGWYASTDRRVDWLGAVGIVGVLGLLLLLFSAISAN